MILTRLIPTLWCAICATSATAHEFWIEPLAFQVQVGAPIVATLKNGEEFDGVSLSYFERRIARFDLVMGSQVTPVTARMGDNPALDVPSSGAGLVVVVHETTPSTLTYKDWAKFQTFADHKDFPDARARHTANGFPEPPFKERYTRHAKALIAVGTGEGADRAMGLKTEFIALTNPYARAFDGQMRVEVRLDGRPRPNAQVEVFERTPDQSVSVSLHRTDASGIAEIAVTRGHDYLFDAVMLAPINATDSEAVWDTYWAALTFSVPE